MDLDPQGIRRLEKFLLLVLIITLASLCMAVLREHRREWRSLGEGGEKRGVVREMVGAGGVVERCITCHILLGEDSDEGGEGPPPPCKSIYLSSHEGMGCTLCHDGDPVSLLKEKAHGLDGATTSFPLLSSSFSYPLCLFCHTRGIFRGGELDPYLLGEGLILRNDCRSCHMLGGPWTKEEGGIRGPPLSKVGSYPYERFRGEKIGMESLERFRGNRRLAYLFDSIKEPGRNFPQTIMPDFELNDREITSIVIYLSGMRENPFPLSSLGSDLLEVIEAPGHTHR